MADYPNPDTRESARLRTADTTIRTTETTSGSSMLFIVGGLVVAVAFIIWLVVGNDRVDRTVVPAGDNNVTIDNVAPPATTDGTTGATPVVPPADADSVTPPAEIEPVTPGGAAPVDPNAAPPATP